MTAAALLLAAAVLAAAGPVGVRRRAGVTPRPPRRATRPGVNDPLAAASTLDVMAVCLSAGMSVGAAASVTAPSAPPGLREVLRRAADLLALGAAAEVAWSGDDDDPLCRALQRLARRSAESGSALAGGLAELAEQGRAQAADRAVAAAERAGVLIAGPLGVCFLPAFIVLGVLPVVAGLAGKVFDAGLL